MFFPYTISCAYLEFNKGFQIPASQYYVEIEHECYW